MYLEILVSNECQLRYRGIKLKRMAFQLEIGQVTKSESAVAEVLQWWL